jgi:hypothetical protein
VRKTLPYRKLSKWKYLVDSYIFIVVLLL